MPTRMDADDLRDAESVLPGDVSVISFVRVENCVNFVRLCIHHVHVIGCLFLLHYNSNYDSITHIIIIH